MSDNKKVQALVDATANNAEIKSLKKYLLSADENYVAGQQLGFDQPTGQQIYNSAIDRLTPMMADAVRKLSPKAESNDIRAAVVAIEHRVENDRYNGNHSPSFAESSAHVDIKNDIDAKGITLHVPTPVASGPAKPGHKR